MTILFKMFLTASPLLLFMSGSAFSQKVLTSPVNVEREDGSAVVYYLELRNQLNHSENLFLFLQGSDCNSVRNVPALDVIKPVYPEADILTVEKYGITDTLPYSMEIRDSLPPGYARFDTPKQRVSDAVKVIEALKKKYGYEKILVFGGSEGATVAYMLASECDNIMATIAIGGGGRFFIEDVIQTIRESDLLPEEKEKEEEEFRQFAQYVLSHDDLDFTMSEHGFKYWKAMLSLDQLEIVGGIDTPVLIMQGGKDTSASPEETTNMVNELKHEGKDNIDYYFYPEYDHSLNLWNEDNAEEVIADIRRWLLDKTGQ